MSKLEFGADGEMKWQRVEPPLWWAAAKRHVVADRHLSNGLRQHMVSGTVAPETFVANAQVIGADDIQNAEFSREPSHLSAA